MKTILTFFTNLFPSHQTTTEGAPPEGFAPHEEFESKRTTKLGMIFVVIMVITGIWQGQSLFRAISSTITPPESLSTCFHRLVSESGERITINYDSSSAYSRYSYQNSLSRSYDNGYYDEYAEAKEPACLYSPFEKKHAIEPLYISVVPLFVEQSMLRRELNDLQTQLSQIKNSSDYTRNSYNTSLLENIGQVGNTVYSTSSLGSTLRTKESQIADLETAITRLETQSNAQTTTIKATILEKISNLRAVADEFNTHLRWLELQRFLLSVILLAPLAFFTLRRYFKAKNERSEFAIIWGAVALVSTILSAQVLVVFAYKIIPHHIIQLIATMFAKLFSQFAILLVILQWFGLILVPLFFGFLVYKIQKKYYNKEAVTMRALKDNKCPRCSMKIKDQMVYCPSCSYELRKKCSSCNHASISYARFCEQCGVSFKEVVK